jgi:hypothetical protein
METMPSAPIQELSAAIEEVCGLTGDADVGPDTRLAEDLGLEWADVQVILEHLARGWQMGLSPAEVVGRLRELPVKAARSEDPAGLTVADLAGMVLGLRASGLAESSVAQTR